MYISFDSEENSSFGSTDLSHRSPLQYSDDEFWGSEWILEDLVDEEEATTSKGSSIDHDEKVPKKKRIRKKRARKIPYIPRIVKHDVRRFYSRMIANVLNSHDISLLSSFLETYAHRDMTFQQSSPNIDYDMKKFSYYCEEGPSQLSIVGIQPFIAYDAIVRQLLPDQAISITESSIKTRSNSEKSEIICRIDVQFTRLYDVGSNALYENIVKNLVVQSPHDVNEPDSLSMNDANSARSSFSNLSRPAESSSESKKADDSRIMSVLTKHEPLSKSDVPDVFEYYLSSTGSNVPMVAEPKSFSLSAIFVIGINERRQIESLSFTTSSITLDEK